MGFPLNDEPFAQFWAKYLGHLFSYESWCLRRSQYSHESNKMISGRRQEHELTPRPRRRFSSPRSSFFHPVHALRVTCLVLLFAVNPGTTWAAPVDAECPNGTTPTEGKRTECIDDDTASTTAITITFPAASGVSISTEDANEDAFFIAF